MCNLMGDHRSGNLEETGEGISCLGIQHHDGKALYRHIPGLPFLGVRFSLNRSMEYIAWCHFYIE